VRAWTRLIVVLLLLALAAAGAAAWIALSSLDEPLSTEAPMRYKVVAGASLARVASELAALGVVSQPRAWVLYARWKGLGSAIKAGEYEIEPGLTPRSLLAKMVKGDVIMHTFTIVDGWRVRDMLAALRRNPDVVATLPADAEGVTDEAELDRKLGFDDSGAEGQFLPETYKFPGGTTDVELLQQAHTALKVRTRGRLERSGCGSAAAKSRTIVDARVDRRKGVFLAGGAAENCRTVPAPPAHRHALAGGPDGDLRSRRTL
jgi:UPF0755 protein